MILLPLRGNDVGLATGTGLVGHRLGWNVWQVLSTYVRMKLTNPSIRNER